MTVNSAIFRVYGSTGGVKSAIFRVWGQSNPTAYSIIPRVWGSTDSAFIVEAGGNWTVSSGDWVPLHAFVLSPISDYDSLSWSQVLLPGQATWKIVSGDGTPDMVVEAPGRQLGEVGTFLATGTKAGYNPATDQITITVGPDNGLARARSTGWDPMYLGDNDNPSHPLLTEGGV